MTTSGTLLDMSFEPTETKSLPTVKIPGWLTAQQVADVAEMPRATFTGYVKRGQAGAPQPTGKVDDRTPLWRASDITKWVKKRETKR